MDVDLPDHRRTAVPASQFASADAGMGESWLGTALGRGFAAILKGGCCCDDGVRTWARGFFVAEGAGRENSVLYDVALLNFVRAGCCGEG